MKSRLPIPVSLVLLVPLLLPAYAPPAFPFAPAAGEEGTTAVAHDDARIGAWATRVVSVAYGDEVAQEWRVPEAALGAAGAVDPDVLVLGRGGSVVLEFSSFIRDGEGDDFVVFENAFRETFLELAYVEVSSDGIHFVRFPNYSYTEGSVGAFGEVDPTYVHGYAGKYRTGFGTPFDLADLEAAHAAIEEGYVGFSGDYWANVQANFPHLDTERVRYVRLVDIPGDGSRLDSEGMPVYDPYPTVITAGFDLDAVGVIHHPDVGILSFAEWSSLHGLIADPEADTDADRWSQYLEYLLGSDPVDPRSIPAVEMTIKPGSGDVFLYSFTWWRNELAETLPIIEYKTGDGPWKREPGRVESLEVRRGEGFSEVLQRIRILSTSPSVWARIVAVPPDG
ncbi:MAG: hypothetical protein ACP5I4_02205 [Oceanipulchritudo sp.]